MGLTEQETNMDSEKLSSVLKCATSNNEDRLNVYKTLASKLKTEEDDVSPDFIKNCKTVINLALTDMCDKFPELSQGSLQFLGLCIHNRFIVDNLSPKESENIIQGLCGCILNTQDKAICTRALWCLSNQIVHLEVLNSQLSNIIDSLDYSFSKPLSQSVLVEHEAVSVVIRLLQQMPKKMQEKSSCWSHHVYGLLGHGAVKVREKALQALTLALPALLQNPNGLIPTMVSDVKAKMANELKKLFNNRNEVYVLKVWSLLVQLLGKELHCVFINQLLPIVELGFKSSIPNIKYEAFCAWKYLIENFAANSAIIGDQKRIKLLMQVFKINNAKTETVAMKKLEVWWYFVKKLDTKILSNFDMVCTPLLRFCVGGKWTQGSRNTPTPKPVNTPLTLPSQGTVWPSFASLQKKGLEVIAHLLKLPHSSVNLPAVELELDALNANVVLGPALFLKQSSAIAYATVELMCSVEASDDLVLYIWCLLVDHMRLGLEAGLKVDSRDALSSFLCDFSTLVLSRQAPYSVKYKLFLAVSKLPKKILCSTAYNISSGEKIHGTPALFLTELLLTPSMLEDGIFQDNYVTLFGNLISMGMANPSGSLEFCQALIQVLDRHAGFVEQTEQLLKLWLCIAHPLLDHITKSNEVNQGDALEHNFTSLYQTLFFPVKWLFGNRLSQASTKSLLKSWGNIYRTFANLAALVVNASANITCEHVSHLILEKLSELEGRLEDPVFVECLVQLCEIVLSCVNFSSHENSAFALSSPGKWSGKRKQKPLKNLHSFVTLLATITSAWNKQFALNENNVVVVVGGTPEKQPSFTTLQLAGKGLVGVFTTLFAGITTSSYVQPILEKCAEPVSGLFAVSKKASNKIYPVSFLPKIDKLWQDIIYCSQNVFTGIYDSDLLSIMVPLLEVNFLHSRRLIKLPTVQFWNATFGQSQSLIYPESLRPVLSKVKSKSMIMLPGWISTEIQIIGETPTNQFSETSSQVADEIPVPIMLSPSKMHGSMLKNVPPSSPCSLVKPKPVKENPACKKLSIGDLKDKDFVVIVPPQNKCRILTQHQQEVLREKKFSLPAMYNSLDQSQDSLAFFSTNSMSNTQNPSQESSNHIFAEAVENKSCVKNAVKPKKKVNFLDQSNKLNIITNSFSNQDIGIKEFALTAQENIAIKPKIQKEIVTKMLQNPVTVQSIKTKDSPKSLLSPGKGKNTQDSTPLQNWLSTSNSKSGEASKNSIQMEPHMSSLIEDSVSTFDSPASNKVPQSLNVVNETIPQKNFSFVEETQSPIKVSPQKVSAESILETPVKTPVIKEIDHNLINTRQLSFDSLEKIANTPSSESPSQEEQSPSETTIELSPVVNIKLDDSQMVIAESEPFYNSPQNGLAASNSDAVACKSIREGGKDPQAENVPMDASDADSSSVSKDNFKAERRPQKRKHRASPDREVSKRTKLDDSTTDNSIEVVTILNSSEDFIGVSPDSSMNVSGTTGTDDSKLHSTDSHEENSPPRKRLTGSRKRKPLKVTKLILTSPTRRISPVKTRSWGKVLRTRKRAVRSTDTKDRKMKRHYKRIKSVNDSDPALIAQTMTEKDNSSCVVTNSVLNNSLEKSIKGDNPAELLSMEKDLGLKPLKSEETIAFVNGSVIEEKEKSISSDQNTIQVVNLDSSQDVSVKSDSASDFAVEEKMVSDSSQDSLSSPDETVNSESLVKKENSTPNSLVSQTPKKSLRLRSGNFPSKFSDSFVYGIKISTSPTSNAKKSSAQKSVMKTSPPQKSVQLTPKETLSSNMVELNNSTRSSAKETNKVESNDLTRSSAKETNGIEKSNKVESNDLTRSNNVVEKSKVEPNNLTQSSVKENNVVNKNNTAESNNLTPLSAKENIAVEKCNESKNKEQLVAKKDILVCSEQIESNNLHPVDKDNIVVNSNAEMTNVVQCVSNPDDVVSNKVESIADSEDITDKVESNVDEPVVSKDDENCNKVEPTMVNSITHDKDNIANCEKIEKQDVVERVAVKDCAMSDTEVVAQSVVNNKDDSIVDNVPVLVATPCTKPPPTCDTPENLRPCSYSPSPVYSPTTGILKKRLVNGTGETPSPPNKQRRVSFADPIFEEKTLPSPVSQKRRLTPGSSKSSRRSLLINYKQKRDSANSNGLSNNSPNGSQSSYSSSQESQLNCTDPIFPDLVNCQEPVGQILPQLTSSIWSRGLGQLLRAKKIHTIGDLASMSEYDIHNLPVRSPKVSNVKTVLTNFKQQQDTKKDKSANTSISEIMVAAAAAHTASIAAAAAAAAASVSPAPTTSVTASTTAARTASTTAAPTLSTTTASEPDVQRLKEKESKINKNVKDSVDSSENPKTETPKTETPEKMEISPTATTNPLLNEESLPTEEKESFLEEMPEIDTSSSFKFDNEDSTWDLEVDSDARSKKELPSFEDITQSTITVSVCSDDLNTSDLITSIRVFENPEASSTPLKPVTETKESDTNVSVKQESSRLTNENSISSGDQSFSMKPICLERKFSSMNCKVKDSTNEDLMVMNEEEDEEKGDYCTVEDDVKSILENSGALLEEVEKLSQSVQELEHSPRSPKFIRKKYKEPESPELEGTEGFDVDHLQPNMSEANSKNVSCSVDSAVQKDLELLPTLKDLSTKFTEKEIRGLDGDEIHEAHECLQQLFSSVMKAVIPGPKNKKTQVGWKI